LRKRIEIEARRAVFRAEIGNALKQHGAVEGIVGRRLRMHRPIALGQAAQWQPLHAGLVLRDGPQ